MPVQRYDDWEERLRIAVIARNKMKFQYGVHDCCVSAGYLISAMTGIDFRLMFKRYTSRSKAKTIAKKYGNVFGLAEAVAQRFELERIDPGFAGRGDAVVVRTPLGQCLGIVDTTGTSVLVPGGRGWQLIALQDRDNVLGAWRIG